MTRERDRIQENANKYIVKNCPAYRAGMNLPHYCKAVGCCINTYVDGIDCTTVTNCVIKQVIAKCKGAVSNYSNLEILRTACETNQAYGKAVMAEQILQLFDIEEI